MGRCVPCKGGGEQKRGNGCGGTSFHLTSLPPVGPACPVAGERCMLRTLEVCPSLSLKSNRLPRSSSPDRTTCSTQSAITPFFSCEVSSHQPMILSLA
eukprot:1527716-Rhodomonas_salina.4